MKKASIIVPVYEVESYLCRCVDSILTQDYVEFEILLIDDGSQDYGGGISDEYSLIDNRIIVIHRPNGGLSAARNSGLDCANGEFVFFVDGDDSIEKKCVSTVISLFTNEVDMVAYGYREIISSSQRDVHRPEQVFNLQISGKREFYLNTLLPCVIGWEACTRAFRRSVIENNYLRFIDNKKIFAEDLCFSIMYCSHAKVICSTEKILYDYFRRDDSIMGTACKELNANRMNELGKTVWSYFDSENKCRELIEIFPIIHYCIMDHVIAKYVEYTGLTVIDIRKLLRRDIHDFDFFARQMRKFRFQKKYLKERYTSSQLEERINVAEYFADGNIVLFKIKCKYNNFLTKLKSK